MLNGPTRLAGLVEEFKQWTGTAYIAEAWYHQETGRPTITFSKKTPGRQTYRAHYEMAGDTGYDSKAIARILKNQIKQQVNDAKARGE